MRIMRETETYRLFEGTLQSRGCFRIERKLDGAVNGWNVGVEGEEWANWLAQLSNVEFDAQCEDEIFFH